MPLAHCENWIVKNQKKYVIISIENQTLHKIKWAKSPTEEEKPGAP